MSKELGILIKRLREENGYRSLRSFAKRIGKSPTFLCKVEHGEAVPSAETLDKIGNWLGSKEEIFQAAGKIAPEIAQLLKEPEVMRLLWKISRMTATEKARQLQEAWQECRIGLSRIYGD